MGRAMVACSVGPATAPRDAHPSLAARPAAVAQARNAPLRADGQRRGWGRRPPAPPAAAARDEPAQPSPAKRAFFQDVTPPPQQAQRQQQEPSPAADAFRRLAATHLEACACALRPCGAGKGNGLVVTAPAGAAAGTVLLRVPLDACLVVDYRPDGGGLRVPPAPWPRLRRGVAKDAALPWDVLLAAALLDALAGDGEGGLWAEYANAVLPAPLELTLPLCYPPPLLAELQHGAIEAAAAAQQQRLAGLFPGLAAPMADGVAAPVGRRMLLCCPAPAATSTIAAHRWPSLPPTLPPCRRPQLPAVGLCLRAQSRVQARRRVLCLRAVPRRRQPRRRPRLRL